MIIKDQSKSFTNKILLLLIHEEEFQKLTSEKQIVLPIITISNIIYCYYINPTIVLNFKDIFTKFFFKNIISLK